MTVTVIRLQCMASILFDRLQQQCWNPVAPEKKSIHLSAPHQWTLFQVTPRTCEQLPVRASGAARSAGCPPCLRGGRQRPLAS